MRSLTAFVVSALVLMSSTARADDPDELVVWHAYADREAAGLEASLAAFRQAHPDVRIVTLAVPFGAYASKLESAIPSGHGPDVFFFAHDGVRSYERDHLIQPVGVEATSLGDMDRRYVDALLVDGSLYGIPLAVKCTALFVNDGFFADAPPSLESILEERRVMPEGSYPLALEAESSYHVAALLHANGGQLLRSDGSYAFTGAAADATLASLINAIRTHAIPENASGALVTQLFVSGHAATAISGPWLLPEIPSLVRFHVEPLPTLNGAPMRSFVTVEAGAIAMGSRHADLARALLRYLASPNGALPRAAVGRQVVTSSSTWNTAELSHDRVLQAFRAAAAEGVLMPTHPNMRMAFEPASRAIQKALRGETSIAEALSEGVHRFQDVTRPLPSERSPAIFYVVLSVLCLLGVGLLVRRASNAEARAELRRSLPAYRYVAHAAIAIGLLVVLPLVVGAGTSFYAGHGRDMHYVGVANYVDILTARGGPIFGHGSFWLVLLVTVLWTVCNLALHVGIGVALALLLSPKMRKLRGVYRVLLILPWAVPSYVTALAWRGMFHTQFGSINALLHALGVEPVSWFAKFSTAFAANLATNTWLGFPFMMVVTLSALAAIPSDVYEAAAVDGATPWQRFRHITLPLLKPSLMPAVAMGAVWTFNMFNVVFLVSGGDPDGSTEILVSEAYRWAFTRSQQYGYAAAYAVLIFLMLVFATRAPWRSRGVSAELA